MSAFLEESCFREEKMWGRRDWFLQGFLASCWQYSKEDPDPLRLCLLFFPETPMAAVFK